MRGGQAFGTTHAQPYHSILSRAPTAEALEQALLVLTA